MPVPLEPFALELGAVLLALTLGAALSALDGALLAFGEVRLLSAREGEGRYAGTAARVLREGPRLATRLLVGRVVALVVAVGLTVRIAARLDASMQSGWWTTAAALALVALIYATLAVGFGAVCRTRAATFALPMARLLRPFEMLVWPLAYPLGAMVGVLDRRVPAPAPTSDDDHAVREVEHMIEQREESGSIPEDFAELLLSVLEFKDTVAREVMVPRTQMKAIAIDAPIDVILETIVREGHSRYPVFRDRVDQIEGILYAKDLFRVMREHLEQEVTDNGWSLHRMIRRPVFFVAETHKIGQLLREMQQRRFHLAVVVDEFGGTSGIVTLEDIVEEIVGEIRDEHDGEEARITLVGDGRWSVDAAVSVYDLAEVIEVELDKDGDFDSVGGMVVELAGRLPSAGESVHSNGLEFVVAEADERHVTRVEVVRLSPGGADITAEGAAAE